MSKVNKTKIEAGYTDNVFETSLNEIPVGDFTHELKGTLLDVANVASAGKMTPKSAFAAKVPAAQVTKPLIKYIGRNGTKVESKTLFQKKGSNARIDVENPNPGQIHFQNGKSGRQEVKAIYDIKQNKFFDMNPKTGVNDIDVTKSVVKTLGKDNVKKAIDRGLEYLGEEK